jgi:hypothetical protein
MRRNTEDIRKKIEGVERGWESEKGSRAMRDRPQVSNWAISE